MIGSIERGEFDTSVAAFSVTYDRTFHVDFTSLVDVIPTHAYILRPGTAGRVSMRAYTSEFKVMI